MKYIKTVLVFCAMLVFSTSYLNAQTTTRINVDAVVSGVDGLPVPGAEVTCDKDLANAETDGKGAFTISVPSGSNLLIAAKGYQTAVVPVSADVKSITLNLPNKQVQVAFRKVDQQDLLGAVSVVDMAQLMEKNYNTYAFSGLGAMVGGFNGTLWGSSSTLVLVDGAPRDITTLHPSEIDQISFLKGVGNLALYGSYGSRGVIYVTTKKGQVGAQRVNVRVNSGQLVPKALPEYLGSAEYRTLYNEARVNDGLSELYTEEDIYNYSSGKNPYIYPNVDYFSDEYLKKSYNRTDVTTEITGGNQMARYYTNIGYATAGSLLDVGEAASARNNRLNIRGNVDVDLNKSVSCYVNASAVFYTGKGARGNYWGNAATIRPDRVAPLIPISAIQSGSVDALNTVNNSDHIIDGKYFLGGTQLNPTNPIADAYAAGTTEYNSRQFQFNTGINIDLQKLLQGLSFSTNMGVDYATSYNTSFASSYATFAPTWVSSENGDSISAVTTYGLDEKSGKQEVSGSWYRQVLSFSSQLNYRNTFGEKHHITSTVLANGFQYGESQVYHRVSNANLGLQAGYDFDNKYYVDFSGGLVYSAYLAEGNRMGFSPTVSLGWRLSKENFLANSSVVDELKLTLSAGQLQSDVEFQNYYQTETKYMQTDGAWYTWRDGSQSQSTDSRWYENKDLKMAKRKEVSVGIEGSFFKNFINLNANVFANRTSDIPLQPSVLFPSYFSNGWPNSSFIPWMNYNEDQRVGADLALTFNKKIGQTLVSLGVVANYYDSKATKRAEMYDDAYQNREGKPLDAIWGLENLGFFASAEDIANSPYQTYGQVKPGDIKYKDQNNDGLIDSKDEVFLGRGGWSAAPLSGGAHLTVKYKNLTFFALGTGRYGAYATKNSSYFWVDGEDKYSAVVRDRWTVDTQSTAKYPRLTTSVSDNNFRGSDFWLYSTNRFDISKVQITYSFSKPVLQKTFLKGLDVYASGFDLLTIAPERETLELNVGSEPQNRMFLMGVKAIF